MNTEERTPEEFGEEIEQYLSTYLRPMIEAIKDTKNPDGVSALAALAIAIGGVGVAFDHEPDFILSAATKSILKIYRDSGEFEGHPFIEAIDKFEAMVDDEDEEYDDFDGTTH